MAALYWSPAFFHLHASGFGDWQVFEHQWEAGAIAWQRYRELPVWDPYLCGGVFLFGDPQSQLYGPLFWLLMPFGTTIGLKLFLVLHASAGFSGMWLFARRALSVGAVAAALAALLWAGSGFFAWHGSGGHAAFAPFYLLPWLWIAFDAAVKDVRYAVLVALLLCVTLLEGGVYPFSYFVLFLMFEASWRLFVQRRHRAVPVLLAVALLTAIGGAFRLLPIWDTMRRYPRFTEETDRLAFGEVITMLTAYDPDTTLVGHAYVWAEYGSFIGFGGLVVCGLGLLLAWRSHRMLVVGTLLFGLLMVGDVGVASPWSLLHRLPVWDSLRVPSRFAVIFLFYFTSCGAVALQRLKRLGVRRSADASRPNVGLARVTAVAILVGVGVELAVGNARVIDRWRGPALPSGEREVPYQLLPPAPFQRDAENPRRNVSSQQCYTGMSYASAQGLWIGPSPQARLVPDNGRIESIDRTTGTITASVQLSRAALLIFNQTFADGWAAEAAPGVGPVAPDVQGRISVSLGPNARRVRLVYQPPFFREATWAFGASFVVFPGWWLVFGPFRRRNPR